MHILIIRIKQITDNMKCMQHHITKHTHTQILLQNKVHSVTRLYIIYNSHLSFTTAYELPWQERHWHEMGGSAVATCSSVRPYCAQALRREAVSPAVLQADVPPREYDEALDRYPHGMMILIWYCMALTSYWLMSTSSSKSNEHYLRDKKSSRRACIRSMSRRRVMHWPRQIK